MPTWIGNVFFLSLIFALVFLSIHFFTTTFAMVSNQSFMIYNFWIPNKRHTHCAVVYLPAFDKSWHADAWTFFFQGNFVFRVNMKRNIRKKPLQLSLKQSLSYLQETSRKKAMTRNATNFWLRTCDKIKNCNNSNNNKWVLFPFPICEKIWEIAVSKLLPAKI